MTKKILTKSQWAYHTTHKNTMQATPYLILFGMEAMLSLEVEQTSLRIAIHYKLTQKENAHL